MKRNKHILINFNEDQYYKIVRLAELTRRKPADICYLLIIDNLEDAILKACNISGSFESIKRKKQF